jgi:hypothetical protein
VIPEAGPSAARYLIAGGIGGLAWASAMRGWMAQLAMGMPHSHSHVTWLTLALVLMPGVGVGTLLGRAAYLRHAGLPASRGLVLAPVIFGSALLDPHIFVALVHNGTGGGSLIVVSTAVSNGYAVTGPPWSVRQALAAFVAMLGLLVIFGMGGMAAPLYTPDGVWVSALGFALVLLLGLASALAHPPAHGTPGLLGFVALGALIGFTWAAGLCGLLAQVTTLRAPTWAGTFLTILLPGTLAGGLLGWAELDNRRGGPPPVRWQLPLVAASLGVITIWTVTAPAEAMRTVDPFTARGAWLAVYVASFAAVLAWGLSVPGRTLAGPGRTARHLEPEESTHRAFLFGDRDASSQTPGDTPLPRTTPHP